MNETITGITLLAGTVSVLLALYHTKSNRGWAKNFLITGVLFYGVAIVSIFTDNDKDNLLIHFQKGNSLMCRDITVSKKDGWEVKKEEYLVKENQIFYIKMCKKI